MSQKLFIYFLVTLFFLSACKSTSEAAPPSPDGDLPSPTATPTEMAVGIPATPENNDRCNGLTGSLEVQILVGPAEAVGLEPTAIGEVPFTVVSTTVPYIIEGSNAIDYESMLQEAWGSYSVFFDMDLNISGECLVDTSGEQLDLNVNYSGEQLVKVDAEGFQGEYPWSGSDDMAITLPLQEGATAEGEGWVFVLHLD